MMMKGRRIGARSRIRCGELCDGDGTLDDAVDPVDAGTSPDDGTDSPDDGGGISIDIGILL